MNALSLLRIWVILGSCYSIHRCLCSALSILCWSLYCLSASVYGFFKLFLLIGIKMMEHANVAMMLMHIILWNNIQVMDTYDTATTNSAMIADKRCVEKGVGLHFPISIFNVYIT